MHTTRPDRSTVRPKLFMQWKLFMQCLKSRKEKGNERLISGLKAVFSSRQPNVESNLRFTVFGNLDTAPQNFGQLDRKIAMDISCFEILDACVAEVIRPDFLVEARTGTPRRHEKPVSRTGIVHFNRKDTAPRKGLCSGGHKIHEYPPHSRRQFRIALRVGPFDRQPALGQQIVSQFTNLRKITNSGFAGRAVSHAVKHDARRQTLGAAFDERYRLVVHVVPDIRHHLHTAANGL